jgi:hypothetical protein
LFFNLDYWNEEYKDNIDKYLNNSNDENEKDINNNIDKNFLSDYVKEKDIMNNLISWK